MKYLFIALVALLVTSCGDDAAQAEVGDRTTMEVKRVYNAGTVVKGENIRAEFKVKNTGDKPLVIADVKPSCSCTVGDFPKEPIAPGEIGVIIANVDTDKVNGSRVDKKVTVLANTTPRTLTLKIKGTIVSK
ncbi:MAG: hypothetical protein DCO96_07655 [Fluviicola sp. XM-24bin1]|nr:MAG: hypothetical protein DCO96_07655 [Fluviicola sp. XM-24bin1]